MEKIYLEGVSYMEQKDLTAVLRKDLKKGPTKQARKAGRIPAVIYGHSSPIAITVDEITFNKSFSDIEANTIFNIDVEGDHRNALVKDFQSDILTGKILHVDFYEIEKGKALRTTVPLKIVGNCPGVKAGGVIEEHMHHLEIECIPKDIPSFIEVNVSNLNLNESIHVSDLVVADTIKVLTGGEQAVVGVTVMKSAVEPTEAAEVDEEEAEEE